MRETTTPQRRVQRVRFELRVRDLQIARVERLSPGFVRLTLQGEQLEGFTSLSFDDHLKLLLTGADGTPLRRDYTPRHFDAARRELQLEFALHGHGGASQWALQAQPGQPATIGGPRGSMVIPMDHDWHLLAGDASALPAIHRRLEELPAGARATVLVQVADAADVRRFDGCAATIDAQWVHDSADWLAALRALRLPPGEGFAWCAGEAQVMAQARDILRQVHGHPQEATRVAAYWKTGAADFHENLV